MSALTDVFTAIANAIRSKKGVSTTYKPSEMADAIRSISTGTDTSDATLDSGSRMLSGYTAYAKGTKYSGSITQRSASSETISSSKTYNSGYYPYSWTVTPQGISANTLWTNTSPTSDFNTHNINLGVSVADLSAIRITWRLSTSDSTEHVIIVKNPSSFTKNDPLALGATSKTASDNYSYHAFRCIYYSSSNSTRLYVSAAETKRSGGLISSSTQVVIPLKVEAISGL